MLCVCVCVCVTHTHTQKPAIHPNSTAKKRPSESAPSTTTRAIRYALNLYRTKKGTRAGTSTDTERPCAPVHLGFVCLCLCGFLFLFPRKSTNNFSFVFFFTFFTFFSSFISCFPFSLARFSFLSYVANFMENQSVALSLSRSVSLLSFSSLLLLLLTSSSSLNSPPRRHRDQ